MHTLDGSNGCHSEARARRCQSVNFLHYASDMALAHSMATNVVLYQQ